MKDSADASTPDPAVIRREIRRGRSAFGNYNVVRLERLIRRLSEEARKIFESIPILLHLNHPGLPGFVDHPRTPHGIFLFSASGFRKRGRMHLGIETKTIQDVLMRNYPVRGVYLAGSAGTHGQTAISDLNYWVLIDPEAVDEEQRELLQRKIDGIRAWALAEGGQALTFLVLDADRLRRNDFSGWAGTCAAISTGGPAKEEFYRTFILIAGQVPYWAVLPAGLNLQEYNRWVQGAARLWDEDFMADDYVDLGPVGCLDREETAGALLSEIAGFRQDPVRSLIKASLLAHDAFLQEQQGLLCERVKQAFRETGSGSESPDPFLYVLERAIQFFESIEDKDGLDLIKACLYLRLSGYPGPPPEKNDSNRDLLRRFRRRWAWSSDQGDRVGGYADWTEQNRLRLEDRILHKLWFLWSLLAQRGESRKACDSGPVSLQALQKRTEERLSRKPHQIPYASAYLRAGRNPLSLHVALQKAPSGADCWAVYGRPNLGTQIEATSLFADPELVRVLGWIVLNGLYGEGRSTFAFLQPQNAVVTKRAERFLEELYRFFQREASPDDLRTEAAWVRLLVVLDIGVGGKPRLRPSARLLAGNSWGETFFFPVDLRQVENGLLRCYEIAGRVRQIQKEARPGEFEYRFYHSRTAEDVQDVKNIEDFLRSLHNDNSRKPLS